MEKFLKKGLDSNVQIVCTLGDLRLLFADWRDEQRENERQVREQQSKKDEYLCTEDVCKLLKVTKPTLWRWAKMAYLVPIKVGKKNFYRQSDIDALRKGGIK